MLSLYVDVERDTLRLLGRQTQLERILIDTNLRLDALDERVTEVHMQAGGLDVPHGRELLFLWHLARALLAEREAVRGRPEPVGRIDYAFELDGEEEQARVRIRPRRRGAPLDLIVAELMILADSHWAGWLAELKRAGINRSQSLQRVGGRWLPGRVRMSTVPAPYESMGVPHYTWCTSPLRRYVDLVNQQQLIAAVRGEPPPWLVLVLFQFADAVLELGQGDMLGLGDAAVGEFGILAHVQDEGVLVVEQHHRFLGADLLDAGEAAAQAATEEHHAGKDGQQDQPDILLDEIYPWTFKMLTRAAV